MPVTIASFTFDYSRSGATGYLRSYNTSGGDFTDPDSMFHPAQSAGGQDYMKEIAFTVASNVATVPTFTHPATWDEAAGARASVTFLILDSNRNKVGILVSDFRIPTLPSTTTFPALQTYNDNAATIRDTDTYTKQQVNYLISSQNWVATGDARVASVVNVKASPYLAAGDGVADDTAEIQAALDAVPASGGAVYLPKGDYLISAGLRPKANTLIFGDGYGTRIRCGDAGWLLVAQTNMGLVNIQGVDNVRVTGLRISGTKAADNAHTPKLIYLENASKVTIDHNYLDTTAFEGIWGGGAQVDLTRIIVALNHIENVGYPAGAFVGLPAIQFNAEEASILGNVINDVGSGIGVSLTRGAVVGNTVRNFTVTGISVGDGTSDGNLTITGNAVEFNEGAGRVGFLFDGGVGDNLMVNVVGNTCRLIGTAGGGNGICYRANTVEHLNLTGNVAEIEVRGRGFQFSGQPQGLTVKASDNVVRVRNESGASIGFNGTADAGTSLTVQSSNNRVYGLTRAQGSYAYSYTSSGGGTLALTSQGDLLSEGYANFGNGSIYVGGSGELSIDNLPVSESSNLAGFTSYERAPRVGMLNFEVKRTLPISGGVLTISGTTASIYKRRTRIEVDVESGASDDLDTINGGQDGDLLILQSTDDGRNVVVKHNTGNILCSADFTLETRRDRILLLYDGDLSKWVCLTKMTN